MLGLSGMQVRFGFTSRAATGLGVHAACLCRLALLRPTSPRKHRCASDVNRSSAMRLKGSPGLGGGGSGWRPCQGPARVVESGGNVTG